jgi:hypothetical protein
VNLQSVEPAPAEAGDDEPVSADFAASLLMFGEAWNNLWR